MSKTKRHQRTIKVIGISSGGPVKRFRNLLRGGFKSQVVVDKGEYVILHERINLDEGNLDLIAYTTDKIYISASPFVPLAKFNELATKIGQLAQKSIKPLEEIRPLSIQRAKDIVGFASNMNLDDEYQRMAIIILVDTSSEMILREMMKAEKIGGPPLDDGIPQKIKRLKDKNLVIPKEEMIKNLRELRNRVVHYGDIPSKSQAEEAIKMAKSVIGSVSKDD